MAQKPNKNLDAVRLQVPLNQGEEYVGAFLSRSKIKWVWFFVIGPLAALSMKQYQIMVTNQRVCFGKLSMFGKVSGVDKFAFNEIESASFKKGMITYNIKFKFRNGKLLNLDANHKALVSIDGFLFDPKMEEYLTKVIA